MAQTTINIDTDLDEQIQKCEELLKKYEALDGHVKKLHFVTVKELAEMHHCSLKTAQDLFKLCDFPSEDFGKEKVVLLEALRSWYMQKRSKKDYE